MKGIKIIITSFLLVMQGSIRCAEAPALETGIFANLPEQVTLVCDDGHLKHVSLRGLYRRFGFFEELFNNWNDSSSSEIRMPSPCSVLDLKKILELEGVEFRYHVVDGVPQSTSNQLYFMLVQRLNPKAEKSLAPSFGASKQRYPEQAVESSPMEKLPDLITVECNDGAIPDVPVALLMENFRYCDALLRNWGTGRFRYTGTAVTVEGTVQAMRYLLCLISSCMWLESEPSALEVLQLADYLELKKEQMDLLKNYYADRLKDELVTPEAYERFLQGDRSGFLFTASLGKEHLPVLRFESTVDITYETIFHAMSPNGKYGMKRGGECLYVYDLSSETKRFLFTIPQQVEEKDPITFSPGGTVVCVRSSASDPQGSTEKVQLWDLASHKLLKEMLLPRGDSLVFSPNDQWIATEQGEVWNITRGESYEIPFHHPDNEVRSGKRAVLAFSPDNQFLAFRSSGNTIGLFDLTSKTVFDLGKPSRAGEKIINISFSPDAKKVGVRVDVTVGSSTTINLEIYDVEKKQLDFKRSNVEEFFFTASPTTLLLEAPLFPGKVGFCDITTGKECMFDQDPPGIEKIRTISETGEDFILSGHMGSNPLGDVTREFFIVHLKNKEHPIPLGNEKMLGDFTFNKEGTLIAGCITIRRVGIFDLTGKLLWSIDLGGILFSYRRRMISDLQFSADGRCLVAKYSGLLAEDGFFEIPVPLAQIKRQELLKHSSEEARYLYHALTARVKAVGHKLDTLSLSEELKEMFDDLPQDLKNEILTEEGQLKRAAEKGLREAS